MGLFSVFDCLPEKLRGVAERWLERAQDRPDTAHVFARLNEEHRRQLARTIALSEFAGNVLLRDSGLIDELVSGAPAAAPGESLRIWRRREMTRIVWRDVNAQSSVPQTLRALSDLADTAIRSAVDAAIRELSPTFGLARNASGAEVSFIVLGMGKLGGHELNFSSDVDLIFLYSEGGETTGPRVVDNAEYFNRLGGTIIRLLDQNTEHGFVFRVDMRLRPFGQSGPLVISLGALEDYLQQHGRDWERYAWIKARPITAAAAYADTYRNCVRPFVYRRYLDFGVFESLRDMKALIAREVSRRDLAQHLKLGTGGIREIEFIAQSFQLVRGGSDPRLQNASILEVMPLLAGSKLLRDSVVTELLDAYFILRKAENAVQMIRDAQTHSLPEDEIDRERVALALGAGHWVAALEQIDAARKTVAQHFDSLVFGAADARRAQADEEMSWFASESSPLADELATRGFPKEEVAPIAAALDSYRCGGPYRRLDEAGRRRARRLLSHLLDRSAGSSAPSTAIERVLRVLEAIGARSSYLALLNEQQSAFDRLIDVCEISGFLARQIAEFPLLLDELVDARLFNELPSRAGFAQELTARMERVSADDPERQVEALRQFQKAAIFAVALADLTHRLPLMKVSDRLTDIAELILQCCMDLAWQQMTASYGVPQCGNSADALRVVKIAVAGYGKLGGLELGYGSDLDLVFLHDSRGEIQQTSGERPSDNGVFFLRLGQRIVHLLTMHSTAGRLYEVDMRLRPNGKGGFLITGLDAFERYQQQEAWTWEHQALLRARAVAGDPGLCAEFERVRHRILTGFIHLDKLRADVAHMRARMRSELSRAKRGEFDIKQDAGGIADIEFLVQYWVLANARRHPELVRYSDNIRQLEALVAVGAADAEVAAWLTDAYRNFRAILHRLTLEGDGNRVVAAAEHEPARARIRGIWEDTFGISES